MATYWTAIQYNNDDNYDGDSIGIFSTKEKAINKILIFIKQIYDDMEEDDLLDLSEERYKMADDLVSWKIIEKEIRRKLEGCNECNGLSYLNYKINKHTIDQ